jgi:phage terminase large subunit-like protein
VTHAATDANRANLAASFLAEVQARYAGTRLGRQELEGVLMEDAEGALWTSAGLERCAVDVPPELGRIVVAVDPPVTGHSGSDACGIVVVGCLADDPQKAVVLEDASVQGVSPLAWAQASIAARDRWEADRIVAEVNQGGELVAEVLRSVDPLVPVTKVHATKGKAARAEPVAALYEQGRVTHLRGLGALEDQMCLMTTNGFEGKGSPDRVDALVWALTELVLRAPRSGRPTVRTL